MYNKSNNKQLRNQPVSFTSFLIRLSIHKRFSYPFAVYDYIIPYGGSSII